MSLKTLAAKKLLQQIWNFSANDVETIYACLTVTIFTQEDEDALLQCLRTMEQTIMDPTYAERFVKDSRTLPLLLSLLKKKHHPGLQVIALRLLKYLAGGDSSIRSTLHQKLQFLTVAVECRGHKLPYPQVIKAFMELLFFLIKDCFQPRQLESLFVKLEGEGRLLFVPYLSQVLRWGMAIVFRENDPERNQFLEVIGQIVYFMKICFEDQMLFCQVALSAVPFLSYLATFPYIHRRWYDREAHGSAAELLRIIKDSRIQLPLETRENEEFVRFLDIFNY